jgi:hypothetical protein
MHPNPDPVLAPNPVLLIKGHPLLKQSPISSADSPEVFGMSLAQPKIRSACGIDLFIREA